MTDALVLAGGRITGPYARAAGTGIKALVPVLGTPVLLRLLEALEATPGVDRVCVVGPEAVRDVLGGRALWQRERDSALANVLAGFERLEAGEGGRALLCGCDVPLASPEALEDFLSRCPEEGEIVMPVVRREPFVRTFPGNLGIYVRLADGAFTAGSQILVRPGALLANLSLVERLFKLRKTQLGMARALGSRFLWRLVTHRLTVAELEARVSELTGCRGRAVLDCRPELAFDIDSLMDLRYVEGWLRRNALS